MNHDETVKYIKNNLCRDDLSANQQDLFDFMGAERYIEFCEYFGGTCSLPVYKIDTLKRAIEKRKLKDDLNLYRSGCVSIKQLAKMHQVSESTVYNILSEGKK